MNPANLEPIDPGVVYDACMFLIAEAAASIPTMTDPRRLAVTYRHVADQHHTAARHAHQVFPDLGVRELAVLVATHRDLERECRAMSRVYGSLAEGSR